MYNQRTAFDFIRLALRRRYLSSKDFCFKHDFEPTYFSRALNGRANVSFNYFIRVCSCLNIKIILDDPTGFRLDK